MNHANNRNFNPRPTMSQRIQHFLNKSLNTRTGELGKVKDFLFDDHHWGVRYLVVRAGSWLTGREVLISPDALLKPEAGDDSLPVDLSEDQVRNAPGVDASRPVSRQEENDLRVYYGWPLYWTDPYYTTLGTGVGSPLPPAAVMLPENEPAGDDEQDPHLRSVTEVTDYKIVARDGELGHVEDFVVDGERWLLTHLIVDTRNWLPGRKVVLPVKTILAVDWAAREVEINLTREEIEDAPDYDEDGGELALHTQALRDYYKDLR